MSLRTLYVFVAILIASQATGQKSLKDQYRELKYLFASERFDEVVQLADSLVNLRNVGLNREMEINSLVMLGVARARLSMPSTVTIELLEVPSQSPSFIEPSFSADFLWALGSSYFKSGKYYYEHQKDHFKVSDSLLHSSMLLFRKEDNLHGVFRCFWSLGAMKAYDDDLPVAMDYYQRAYELALENDFIEIVSIVNAIGVLHNDAYRWEDTIEIINRLLKNEDMPKEYWRYCYPYLTIGEAYYRLQQWNEAVESFKKVIELVSDDRGKVARMYAYDFLSYSYFKLNDFDSARFWIKQGEEYISDPESRIVQYLGRTKAYLAVKDGNFEEALKYATIHRIQAEKDGWGEDLNESNFLHFYLYKAWGKPETALPYFERYAIYKDSIRKSAYVRTFENYKVRLKTAEQQADILQLEKEVQARNMRLIILIIGLAFALIAGYLTIKHFKSEKEKIRKELLSKEQQLSDYTAFMLKRNQTLVELDELIAESTHGLNSDLAKKLNRLKRVLAISKNEEENWSKFFEYFGAVHKDFFERLKKKYVKLSAKELRHCALVKMNLSLKESADLFGVEANSVKMARYRIKKKMELDENTDLFNVISQV